jgi:hypothetical protein
MSHSDKWIALIVTQPSLCKANRCYFEEVEGDGGGEACESCVAHSLVRNAVYRYLHVFSEWNSEMVDTISILKDDLRIRKGM